MSKYLSEKLESTPGAYIAELSIIASEIFNPSKSNAIEDFECLPFEKICKVLGWKNNDKVHNLIKDAIKEQDDSLAVLMHQNNRNGFLATVHFPECSDFYFNDDGGAKPKRWKVSHGVCKIAYIYADSIAELFDKIVVQSKVLFKASVEKETQEKLKESQKN